jgi:hypothetical protein
VNEKKSFTDKFIDIGLVAAISVFVLMALTYTVVVVGAFIKFVIMAD